MIGILGGIFGIGGGVIAIPALSLVGSLSQQAAEGTAMLMVVSNLLMGALNYHKQKKIDWKLAIVLGLSSIPTNVLSSSLATRISSSTLREYFAVFLFLLAAETVRKAYRTKPAVELDGLKSHDIAMHWAIVLGLAAGFLAGLFGVGGGLFIIAMLALCFGYSQAMAQGVSTVSSLPGALINLVAYSKAGNVHWETGLFLAVGGFATVPLGVYCAVHLRERLLKTLFAALATISGIALLLHR